MIVTFSCCFFHKADEEGKAGREKEGYVGKEGDGDGKIGG